jgi:hypothetical protein
MVVAGRADGTVCVLTFSSATHMCLRGERVVVVQAKRKRFKKLIRVVADGGPNDRAGASKSLPIADERNFVTLQGPCGQYCRRVVGWGKTIGFWINKQRCTIRDGHVSGWDKNLT